MERLQFGIKLRNILEIRSNRLIDEVIRNDYRLIPIALRYLARISRMCSLRTWMAMARMNTFCLQKAAKKNLSSLNISFVTPKVAEMLPCSVSLKKTKRTV